jgi:hypothetical protein
VRPSVGCIVHYVGPLTEHGDGTFRPGPCRAAIVTHVIEPNQHDAYVDLTVFTPNGQMLDGAVKYDAARAEAETWHWPERT